MANEQRRQDACRHRAVVRLYTLDNGVRSFEEILHAIQTRWPISCSSPEFVARLRTIFDREAAERSRWYADRAMLVFTREYCRGMEFDRLCANVRRRARKLSRNQIFMGEIERLFNEAKEPSEAAA